MQRLSLLALLVGLSFVACKKEAPKDDTSEEKSDKAEKKKKTSDDDDESPKKKKKKTDDDEGDKPKPGNCKLLTMKEGEDILGYQPNLTTDQEDKTCNINPPAGAMNWVASITNHDYNETMWGMAKSKGEAIDDLGDKAMWSGLGLFVKKGDRLLQIVAIGFNKTKEDQKKVQTKLAKAALGHMK